MRSLRSLVAGLPGTFWYLWAGMLVNRLGGFVFPFLALYLTSARKMPVDQAAWIVSLFGAGSFAAAVVGGRLADLAGRRATMLAALFGGGTAMLALGMAERPWAIALATFVLALVQDMFRPAANAVIADVVPPEDRQRAFGLLYWAANLGFAIAPVVAGFMATRSYLWLFAGDAATTFLCGALVWLKVPETRPERSADAPSGRQGAALLRPFLDPVFASFLGLTLLVALLFFQAHLALPIDMKAHGLSEATYGGVIAVNGVMIVLFQPFASRVTERFRRSAVLAAGALLVGAGLGLYAFFTTLQAYVAGVMIFTAGEILMAGLSPAIVSDLAPARLRGTYQGMFHMAWGLASFLGPLASGLVFRALGARALWLGCLVVGAAGATGHLLIAEPRRRRLLKLRAAAIQVSAGED